jgi:hypothetical protein
MRPEVETTRTQEVQPRTGRRGFLTGIAGALAALAARDLVSTPNAGAANGDAVKAGQSVSATSFTKVTNTSDTGAGLWGVANGATRHGVFGTNTGAGHGVGGAASGTGAAGVHGTTDGGEGYGVWGDSSGNFGTGVYGTSGGNGVSGASDGDTFAGVLGTATGTAAFGVYGYATGVGGIGVNGAAIASGGVGVRGRAHAPGSVAVFADDDGSAGVIALKVGGAAVFSRSGLVTVPKGSKSAKVTGVSLSATSLVLATVQAKARQYVQAAVPDVTGSRFTIELNKAAATDLSIAWFIVN